jgi:protein SCO1
MSSRRLLLPAVLSLLLLGALLFALLAGGSSDQRGKHKPIQAPTTGQGGFYGAELPEARPAPSFALKDQDGRVVSLAGLRGQPVIVTAAYTRCGASCRVIAQQIRGALNEMTRPVGVVIISADPATDTPQAVHAFLARASLTGRAHYLTGTEAQLRPLWHAFRVTPGAEGQETFAGHAFVMLLDSSGRERVLYSEEQLTPEALSHDVQRLEGDPTKP